MTESVKNRAGRIPMRLRARIAILVTIFSAMMFLLVALGGWLVVLEAEDAILETTLAEALKTATRPNVSSSPEWYSEYASVDAFSERMQLSPIPENEGVYEVFANDAGDAAIWVHDWSSRLNMWLGEDREREFRLVVEPPGTAPGYRLIDLGYFEFTESRVEAIQRSVLVAAGVMGLAALGLSFVIGRWTLHPILRLADEGRRPAVEGVVSLRPVIDEVVGEQASLNLPRTLQSEILVPTNVTVRASRDVVLVLVQNFVANIWRHAGANRFRVSWKAPSVLTIEDDGSGFVHASGDAKPSAGDSAGFGVGLSLSERLCRLQGWSLHHGKSELGGARVAIDFSDWSTD